MAYTGGKQTVEHYIVLCGISEQLRECQHMMLGDGQNDQCGFFSFISTIFTTNEFFKYYVILLKYIIVN